MINEYLQYLQESYNSKALPKDLIKAMRDNNIFHSMQDVDKIDKLHKAEISFFHDQLKQATRSKKKDPEWFRMVKDELALIKSKKLYCILNYGNGDTAWFSFKDKKIYDWGHEGNSFYPIKSPEFPSGKKRCWSPTSYKQWIKDVINRKHIDSWIGDKK